MPRYRVCPLHGLRESHKILETSCCPKWTLHVMKQSLLIRDETFPLQPTHDSFNKAHFCELSNNDYLFYRCVSFISGDSAVRVPCLLTDRYWPLTSRAISHRTLLAFETDFALRSVHRKGTLSSNSASRKTERKLLVQDGAGTEWGFVAYVGTAVTYPFGPAWNYAHPFDTLFRRRAGEAHKKCTRTAWVQVSI